jgi:hypothetical protein
MRYVKMLITVVFVVAALNAFVAYAATSGRDPRPRPDGIKCQSVPGGVENMEEVQDADAGPTYYNSVKGHVAFISSTLAITSPFNLALWDADGEPTTAITFTHQGRTVDAFAFNTGDNEWSDWVTVTQEVDAIQVLAPLTHRSTSLCFRPGERAPVADLALVGEVIGTPTNIPGDDEPIAPATAYTMTVPSGATVRMVYVIVNTGAVTATGVQIGLSHLGTNDETYPASAHNVYIGTLAPGERYEFKTDVIAVTGVNAYDAEIILAEPGDVDSTPNNRNPYEDDFTALAFIGEGSQVRQVLFLPLVAK